MKASGHGHAVTSETPAAIQTAEMLILVNRRIPFDELKRQIGVGRGTLHDISHVGLKNCTH